MHAVSVNNLTKTYNKGKTIAVNAVSFTINQGEIFGLIGPDGAGKTSIFRMLTTLLLPDSGTASIEDLDVVKDYKKIRNTIGYMPGRFSLYTDLTVEENLNFFATLFNTTVEENYHLIKRIYEQLEPFKTRRAEKLSGGMKQKLALCCALIHKPSVLFLDEPTTGVDPVSRKEFWEILKELKAQNITILVSTPYMDEAVLCDRIALMQKGELLAIDTPSEITRSYPNDLFAIRSESMSKLLKAIQNYIQKESGYAFGEFAHISFKKGTMTEEKLRSYFKEQGLTQIKTNKIEAKVEDCFIYLLNN